MNRRQLSQNERVNAEKTRTCVIVVQSIVTYGAHPIIVWCCILVLVIYI